MKYGQMADEEMGRRPGGRRGRGRPRQGTEQRTTAEQRQRIRAWFARLRAATSLELTAAGGVTTMEDVRALLASSV